MTFYFLSILAYLTLLVTLSAIKSRKIKDQKDFLVAGQGATAWLLVATLVATWIGSGSLFAGAGASFRNGFSYTWSAVGAWAGIACVFFLAHRVRRMAKLSVPEILEARFSAAPRVLGSLVVIIAYLSIAGYQFRGMGRLLNIASENAIDPLTGALIACGFIVLFTALAGMTSIVSFDFFNGILMLLGIGLAIPFVLGGADAGGLEGVQKALPASHFDASGEKTGFAWLGLALPVFFLLLGDNGMYQKFFSARDEKTARRAVIGMIIGVICVESAIIALAVFGSAKYYNDEAFRIDQATVEIDGEPVELTGLRTGLDRFGSKRTRGVALRARSGSSRVSGRGTRGRGCTRQEQDRSRDPLRGARSAAGVPGLSAVHRRRGDRVLDGEHVLDGGLDESDARLLPTLPAARCRRARDHLGPARDPGCCGFRRLPHRHEGHLHHSARLRGLQHHRGPA